MDSEKGMVSKMELTIERLSKQYKNKIAVDRVSAVMNKGVYGLLGANGAGKTTLMRLLCGILIPSSGEVKLDGKEILNMGEEYRDRLGYLPQDFGYYPNFTAIEFMNYIASLKGLNRRYTKKKSGELLEQAGLLDVSGQKIKTFSGGMKQRLGIAQTMLNDPDIIILDEPTAGLDPKERVRFRKLIADMGKDKLILLSTHIVSDVEAIADRILLMKKGQFLANGTAAELEQHIGGKVWIYTGDREEKGDMGSRFIISNIHHTENGTEYRIISDEKPFSGAVPVDGTLEDLYLYYFGNDN